MKEFIIMITVLFVLTVAGFGLIFYKTNSSTENTVPPIPLGKAEYVAQCTKWVGNGFHGKTCAEYKIFKIEE